MLKRVIPNESWQLIMEFDNNEFRLFTVALLYKIPDYSFLAFPNQLKGFTYDAHRITWKNGTVLDHHILYAYSKAVALEDLTTHWLCLGSKNQAPTAKHLTHHVYEVSLCPFNIDKPFMLSETIGWGYADKGGSVNLSIAGMLDRKNWMEHFLLAGCNWAPSIIERFKDEPILLIDRLVKEVVQKNSKLIHNMKYK